MIYKRRNEAERSKPHCCRSCDVASSSRFSLAVLDYHGVLVVEPGLPGSVASGLLMKGTEPVELGGVGLEYP